MMTKKLPGIPNPTWLARLVILGIAVLLIALWVGFISTLTASHNEVPNDLKQSPVKDQPGELMIDPEQNNQQAGRSKNQGQNPGLANANLRNETALATVTEQQLAIAERHFNALRLTIPDGNNALDIYRNILGKDPHNVMANQGIKRIAKKYTELAESKYSEGALDKARLYLEQAIALDSELELNPKLLVEIDKLLDQNKTTNQHSLDDSNQSESLAKEKKVVKLLATAEQQFAKSKLKFPEQDNAFETYTTILSIIPNEQRALDGIQRIANYYLNKAQKLRSVGNFDKSLLLINRGLRVSPDHQQLAALKQQIKAELDNTSKLNEIQPLLNQADQQIAASKLVLPHNNNAYQTYLSILAIDSSNQHAIQGIQHLQQQLQSQISAALDKQDFRTALEVTNKVLLIMAGGDSNSLHNEVAYNAIEAKKIINNQLDYLLALADKQRKIQRYTQPAGDNAFESYSKVLDIDPANQDAIQGLTKLQQEYQLLIKAELSDGNIGHALAAANEGLNAFPDNFALKVLRDNILATQKATVEEDNASTKEKTADTEDSKLKTFGTF